MKFQLPDPAWVSTQKRYEVPDVVITPEEGELLLDLAIRIAHAAIEASSDRRGLGCLDPHVDEEVITDEDLRDLRAEAAGGKIDIDYWKGRMVKLFLALKGDHLTISLNVWADRWPTNATNTIPDCAVFHLKYVLRQASA